MNPGELRHPLELQLSTKSVSASGERSDAYSTIATPWGKVEPISAREYERAKSFAATVSHKITLRFFPGLSPRHRILLDKRVFLINGVVNTQERDYEHVVFATEFLQSGFDVVKVYSAADAEAYVDLNGTLAGAAALDASWTPGWFELLVNGSWTGADGVTVLVPGHSGAASTVIFSDGAFPQTIAAGTQWRLNQAPNGIAYPVRGVTV